MAPCLCDYQNWKHGRIVHSGKTYFGSVCRMFAELPRVQNQMSAPSLQSVSRRNSISARPQSVHWFMSLRRILASRSCVGTTSWMTVNQTDFMTSVVQTVCRLFHTFGHGMSGCSAIIRTPDVCFAASIIMCKVVYIHCRKHFSFSAFVGSMTYAMSIAYMCRYANFKGICRACGGLACWPISSRTVAMLPSQILLVCFVDTYGIGEVSCISHQYLPTPILPYVLGVSNQRPSDL
jgi:hypothetical protein